MSPSAPASAIPPLTCSAALTHHWLVRWRGGEKVLEAIAELLPAAPLYTLVADPAGAELADHPALRDRAIHTSLLQRAPGAARHYPKLLPLMPWAARRMRLPQVDLVVCSDAAVAKAMTPAAGSRVVCYCHSPPRYAYHPEIAAEYRAGLPWFGRPVWDLALPLVRCIDRAAAQRVDQFVANSRHVAGRIREWYGRESIVIHPPVELPERPAAGPREDYYLSVGFHALYKRLDLAIEACLRLGRSLVVIGAGPGVPGGERQAALARQGIRFLGWQADAAIRGHYAAARGLLFPGEEDFGIVPVEAMAHGCPVIAYGVGGAAETVRPEQTGVLFDAQTVDSLAAAMQRFERLHFDAGRMHAEMQRFSRRRFQSELRELLLAVLRGPAGRGAR